MRSRPASQLLSRRGALLRLAGLAALGSVSCRRQGTPAFSFTPGLFEVRETSAWIWVRTTKAVGLQAEYSEHADFSGSQRTLPVATDAQRDFTGVLKLAGLKPGTRYYVRVVSAQGSKEVGPVLELTTVPRRADRVRFAWGADFNETFRPFRFLDELGKHEPDFFLLLGDTAYADWDPQPATDLRGFRRKHRSIRADPHLQRLVMRTPIVATWDDHEVANNFDASHPALGAGRRAFEEYWPVEAGASDGRGLYRSFSWGGLVEVFVLDTRSFRQPEGRQNRSMLGQEQMAWLLRGLLDSTAPLKIVASSVPFHAPFSPDTWFGFPGERARIINHVQQNRISGVIVVSGDLHLAWDLSNESSGIYEFVAGPCAAPPFADLFPPTVQFVRDTGRWHLLDALNFGLVTVERRAEHVEATIEVVDQRGQKHLVRRISVSG